MEGTLARGAFVHLAWELGREAATGGLTIDERGAAAARHELYLRRGYLTYAQVAGLEAPLGQILVASGAVGAAQVARTVAAGGPRLVGQALRAAGAVSDAELDGALRRQAELRLARLCAMPAGVYRFDVAAPAPPAHRSGRPIALAGWARRHVEARFDFGQARALAAALEGQRLVLRKDRAPDAGDCDETDRRILAALATPRRLDEIARAARAPERRLLAFVYFLREVGALAGARPAARQAPGAAAAPAAGAAHRVLGVAAGTDAATLKQAYRRLARRLHPDLHPEAEPRARRALELELAAVNAAYRELTRP